MEYADESDKVYVGRELTPEQFGRWFAAQDLGQRPFNAVGIHHTYRPDASQWTGVGRLRAVFDDYYHRRGWRPWGVGPHLWLYDGTGPYERGRQLVYVATHPRHDGYGIAGRNARWLHIEAIGYYDHVEMPPEMVELYRRVLRIVCGGRIPIRNCAPGRDDPREPLGLMFHRDAPGAGKTCPGLTVTADRFFPAMRAGAAPASDGKLFAECERAVGVPRVSAKPARLLPGAYVRKSPTTDSPSIYRGSGGEVRVVGWEEGRAVGGSEVWYLVRVGEGAPEEADEVGYAHASVLETRSGTPFARSTEARHAPRLCASPARVPRRVAVRRGASARSPLLCEGPEEDVRVVGWRPGQQLGGSAVWYLARLGYASRDVPDRIGYVHASVLYER